MAPLKILSGHRKSTGEFFIGETKRRIVMSMIDKNE